MKKMMILILVLALAAAGCSPKKQEAVKIAAGTPAYLLAKEVAKILPALDPDKITVVATSKTFDVTAGEVIQMFVDSLGSGAEQLKTLDVQKMKSAIEQGGMQIGERKLLVEAAVAAKKTTTPEDLKAALDAQFAKAGGEDQYIQLLKTNGVSLDFVKKRIGEGLLIQKYLEGTLGAGIQVTDAEIHKAYSEDQTASVRHILLLTQGKPAAEKEKARLKMEGILVRAKKGEDFVALVNEFSEDVDSKAKGGLYEDFPRGQMVKPFEDAAFSVPVGQISGIVETTYGYHILKVENRKKETKPFDEVKAQIESQIKQQKQRAALDAHLTRLKTKANLKAVAL